MLSRCRYDKSERFRISDLIQQECFNCPYTTDSFPVYAESIPGGPSTDMLMAEAKRHSIYLIGGKFNLIPKICSISIEHAVSRFYP